MTVREQLLYALLVACGLALVGWFGVVWFSPTSIPHGFSGDWHFIDLVLFVTVTWVVWQQIAGQVSLWFLANTIKRPLSMTALPGYRVAFISTFVPGSESLDLLRRNLPAMVAADYPHDTWLLDEGGLPEVREICRTLGVRYFSRNGIARYNADEGTFAARTKAGNHNAWYDSHGSEYDIVAQIDTDFCPSKDFLTRTLGFFNDPDVAFVGTPQVYGNTDESRIARGAAEQQYTFYGPVMQGMSGIDTALMIGANHVVRVCALNDIGLYAGHVTEDLLTGMTLHAQRWKSIYVPETLAVGEGPSTWAAYFTQQMRWAYGCIDILFRFSPRLLIRMGPRRFLRYLLLQQHYFSGLALGLGIVLLLTYFVTGDAASTLSPGAILEIYLPLVLWQQLIGTALRRFSVDRSENKALLWRGVLVSIAVLPVYLLALVGVVRHRRLGYHVTPKGKEHGESQDESVLIFAPHMALGALTATGIGIGVALHHVSLVLMTWAILNTMVMFGVPLVAAMQHFVRRHRGRHVLARPARSGQVDLGLPDIILGRAAFVDSSTAISRRDA